MSMSTHIDGIVLADEKYKKMLAIINHCMELHIAAPDEVMDFFNWEEPNEKGFSVDLIKNCCTEWSNDSSSGYELDLDLLPKKVKIIRFYNSW